MDGRLTTNQEDESSSLSAGADVLVAQRKSAGVRSRRLKVRALPRTQPVDQWLNASFIRTAAAVRIRPTGLHGDSSAGRASVLQTEARRFDSDSPYRSAISAHVAQLAEASG